MPPMVVCFSAVADRVYALRDGLIIARSPLQSIGSHQTYVVTLASMPDTD